MTAYKMRFTAGLKWVLLYLGVYALMRRLLPRQDVAVLRYHAVCEPTCTYASPTISVTPAAFRAQIRYLTAHYAVLPLDVVVASLQQGKVLPQNTVAITFDDGYQDNYLAFQILQEYGGTATFFLTTNCIDDRELFWVSEVRYLMMEAGQRQFDLPVKGISHAFDLSTTAQRKAAVSEVTRLIKTCTIAEREAVRQALRHALGDVERTVDNAPLMLSTTEIRDMLDGRMTIGGHTLSHCNLPSAGLEDAAHELIGCHQELSQRFGVVAPAMAYPNGGANAYVTADIQRLVQAAGYSSAWTSEHGYVTAKTDWYQGPRIAVRESLADLIHLLEGERFVDLLR